MNKEFTKDMLEIDNYEDITITSIKYKGAIVHFKYKNEHYFVQNAKIECTPMMQLFRGRTKYKNQLLKSAYGMSLQLIRYINNKKVLKYIDKENFVNELHKKGLILR